MTKKKEILIRLAESRRMLNQAVEGLSQEEMTQVRVEGVWTVKDVLGHIASWEGTCLEPLRRYADGGPYVVEVIENDMAWNEEQAARKQDLPLDTILEELAAIRRGIVEAATRLPEERWTQSVPFAWGGEGTIADTLEGLYQHELEHVHNMRAGRE
jgi:uncharacterized damage-inducible protein DinB